MVNIIITAGGLISFAFLGINIEIFIFIFFYVARNQP
ncbi:hypothetical protein BSPWISOXPB_713 [uncultured Gammaproteobacteria bacterium]|nr:hypothetical protein BSPWISOXPB_713 [uncultured Gammaproteobacteria bacterium]